jgi:twitching motility two-component system response regulator PilG
MILFVRKSDARFFVDVRNFFKTIREPVMTNLHINSAETEKNVLLYLKSQQALAGSCHVSVKNVKYRGMLQIRKGQVVAAFCGKLTGNGALLTLAAIRDGEIAATTAVGPFDPNVSLSLPLVERLLSKAAVPGGAAGGCNEEETLEEAIRLIYQFRRTEAVPKLVEVLRSNRFYYPAWLWQSRLMTREDYIKKALAEARKWGNSDVLIQRENEKIEPQLNSSQEVVKRCIFCWSLMSAAEIRCRTCQGILRPGADHLQAQASTSLELIQSLQAYEHELQLHPKNSRIAYCLFLGHLSLAHIDKAREFINRALHLSPREPIFIRGASLLPQSARPVAKVVTPIAKETTPTVKIEPVASPSPVPPVIGGGKTILMVEDSQTSRKVISMLLGRKGYTIIEAITGGEALQRSEEGIPDLVLLDVMLPDMSGYEVLSRMRQNQRMADVPVVMLTGKSNPSDRLKGLHHGSNEYLTKPFDPAKLLAVLEKYLESPPPPPAPAVHKPAAVPPAPPKPVQREEPPLATRVEKSRPVPVTAPPLRESPLAAQPVGVASPPVAPLANLSRPDPGKGEKTVLVVEDSPTSRKVISMVLARRGYVIEEAPTGGAALRKLEGITPDLILLDAMLPDMSGYDILARVKKEPKLKDIPVVMLTAKNNPLDRQKGLRGGLAAFLTKPFDPEKLLAVIDDHI